MQITNTQGDEMAYIDQTKKEKIAAELKKVMPKDWKYSLRIDHHSTIIMTIIAAPVDLFKLHKQNDNWSDGYIQLNEYYLDTQYDGDVLAVIQAARAALNIDNFNKSDIQADYFHVGHYVSIRIGRWNKPFVFTGKAVAS
jgi:hypothetical protein